MTDRGSVPGCNLVLWEAISGHTNARKKDPQ